MLQFEGADENEICSRCGAFAWQHRRARTNIVGDANAVDIDAERAQHGAGVSLPFFTEHLDCAR